MESGIFASDDLFSQRDIYLTIPTNEAENILIILYGVF